jgi:hypothetical protein
MKWAGHVACIGVMRNAYQILVEKSERKRQLGDLDVDGRVMLNYIIKK